ncbi:MAG TPA: cupredoxin domain-containing protein [Actinomycetota bacterium]|nr:cupredoxin domain-containing protein [Actinomycetota bacterium]
MRKAFPSLGPILGLVLVLFVLTLTACSDGGGDARDRSAACVDLTTEGETFTIRLVDNRFVPSCFTVSASQGLRVVNEDRSLHSFTLDGTPVDIDIAGGETLTGEPVTGIVAPGTYDLLCKYHVPGMRGEVTVVG